jgi:hypothetical protein
MKYLSMFYNVFLIGTIGYMVIQLIPDMVSSNDSVNFVIGVILVLISITVIVSRLFEIYNEIKEKF